MKTATLGRSLRIHLTAASSDPHPGSYPFVSGDTFRSLAQHAYDEKTKCTAEEIKESDIVFVKTDLIREFFRNIHPYIKAHYKLITHNSDRTIEKEDLAFIDEKIIRWFAHNALVSHPKLTPIPIGLENVSYHEWGDIEIIQQIRKTSTTKTNRILFGFTVGTNPAGRAPVLNALRATAAADEIKDRLNPKRYFEKLKTYKFVAAPAGNGPDTHRVWEALLFGVIPVVQRSPMYEYFQKIGLPVLMIDDWNELKQMSERELEAAYEKIMATHGPTKDNLMAYAYWQGIIRVAEDRRDEAAVVIAIGQKFQEKYGRFFRKTHERFCFNARLPLVIIGEYIQKSEKGPAWQKLLMFRTPILSNMTRIVMIDADIYIKDGSKNPLDIVPKDRWGLAENNAFDLPWLKAGTPILYVDCPPDNRPDFVLNTGLFIVNKNIHEKTMEYVFSHYKKQVCEEQGPFCYHLINEFPGTILPFAFNNIVSSYIEKFGYSMTTIVTMYKESYGLHFAGSTGHNVLKMTVIFDRFPAVFKIISQKPVLFFMDKISYIMKKAKGI
jgi:hypothetical protein